MAKTVMSTPVVSRSIAQLCRRLWAVVRLAASEGHVLCAVPAAWPQGAERRQGSAGRRAGRGTAALRGCLPFAHPAPEELDGRLSNGVSRRLRPLPRHLRCAPVPSSTSWRRRPVSSESRRPVLKATVNSRWSRRPSQVPRSGAASRASISTSVRNERRFFWARFCRDREHLLDERGVLGMTAGGEAEQRVDGGQPGVAAADAVGPVALEVIKEAADQRRVEVGQVEVGRILAGLRPGEGEQQAEGVPVANRPCAGWRRAHGQAGW